MRLFFIVPLLALSVSRSDGADLPRSSPEAQGVSSPAVLAFVAAADKQIDSLHSFMLVRHGHVVAECWWAPYAAQSPHSLFSLSKSFHIDGSRTGDRRGKVEHRRSRTKVLPRRRPAEPSANLKAMRLNDLLRMSTGHQAEPAGRTNRGPRRSSQSVPFKPGTTSCTTRQPLTCSRPACRRRPASPSLTI